jgi:hypothetical protein
MNTTLKELQATETVPGSDELRRAGALILNADDWGRDRETTDRTFECVQAKALSSASAMMFMADSERAAEIALSHNVDIGLHLNLTTPFSGAAPAELQEHHRRVSRYLKSSRLAQVVFHPGLHRSFQYVVVTQVNEFRRLYQRDAERVDGHHHMHLCANVLFGQLMPAGTIARRNFSFRAGEKSIVNRLYRRRLDSRLAKRHHLTDYFYSLPPLEPRARLAQIFALAAQCFVEVETHPVNPEEYRFLCGGEIFRVAAPIQISPRYFVR